jgi:hypothetical protein
VRFIVAAILILLWHQASQPISGWACPASTTCSATALLKQVSIGKVKAKQKLYFSNFQQRQYFWQPRSNSTVLQRS